MTRYRIFLPNATQLNSVAGHLKDYMLWVAVAPANRNRTRCFTCVGLEYDGRRGDPDRPITVIGAPRR